MKLTATIIAYNEEENLPRVVNSVKNLADEIVVVVDARTTDRTRELAEKIGARVFERRFDNFANQKNFAASKASGDWILSLDADEEISPELSREIKSVISHQSSAISKFVAYSMPRKNLILGKFIKYTRWQPELDRHVWLWRKGKGKWVGEVHEELEVDGEVGKLKNPKIHYQYETVSQFLEMMDRYSELDASQRLKSGIRFSFFRLFFGPLYNFLVRYFYRLGFLDSWRGFVLSFLMAIYHLELWIKVWERQK